MQRDDPDWDRPRHLGIDQHSDWSLSPCCQWFTPGCSEDAFAFDKNPPDFDLGSPPGLSLSPSVFMCAFAPHTYKSVCEAMCV